LKSETKQEDTHDGVEHSLPGIVAEPEEDTSQVVLVFVLWLGEHLTHFAEELLIVDLSELKITSVCLA
jgi:hypothetical protein